MESQVSFSPEEDKIRKRWLFWQIKIPAFLYSIFVLLFVIFHPFGLLNSLLYLLLITTILSMFLYIPYHCAYKKHGTIYLIFYLISSPILLAKDAFEVPELIANDSDLILMSLVLFIVQIVYASLLFYLSFKLLKINQNTENKILILSEYYSDASSIFKLATTLEELNEKFTCLVKDQNQSGQVRLCIAEAYKERKKALEIAQA